MAFPSFAWKYVPSSGVPTPPRWRPPCGGAAGGGLWRAFGCASLAEAGECGACAPGAGPAIHSSGLAFRGCCLQMGPSGSHRRASGVSSRAPTVADVRAARSRAGLGSQAIPFASARPPPSRAIVARRRGRLLLCALRLNLLHRMEQDYPLNLSISLSGGKETNRDAPSNGE